MKVYQVFFDSIVMTVIVDCKEELFTTLQEEDDKFYEEEDKIMYKWNYDYSSECDIQDVTDKRGIIHVESH